MRKRRYPYVREAWPASPQFSGWIERSVARWKESRRSLPKQNHRAAERPIHHGLALDRGERLYISACS